MDFVPSASLPTFYFFINDPAATGDYAPQAGLTGLVEADFDVYAADPGSALPGSPISTSDYALTAYGYGLYKIVFSANTYFVTSGKAAVVVTLAGDSTKIIASLWYKVGYPEVDVASVQADAIEADDFAADAKLNLFGILNEGTLQSSISNTINSAKLAASAPGTTGYLVGAYFLITGGLGLGQAPRLITGYTSGTKVAVFTPNLTTAPDDTTTYAVVGAGNVNVETQTATVTAAIAAAVAAGTVAGVVGSVTGSVGSVTGAVGSVTGNVGGNVTGSVGSVVANVNADVVKISGDTTAADNLELQFDTTGLTGATFPMRQDASISVDTAAVADAVWDESRAGHVIAGSFGEGVVVSSLLTAAKDAIVATLMAYSHDTGLTVKGAFRRMDALVAGKATGLKGAIARFFMRDGTTVAVQAPQDTAAGTRSAASVTGSES